jgi:hypothetical protein
MYSKILLLALGLALVGMACNLTVNLPEVDLPEVTLPAINLQTIPATSEPVQVPLPGEDTQVSDLELNFAAGEMNVSPGAQGALVSGTTTYNMSELKPEVTVTGTKVTISHVGGELNNIPEFGANLENRWDLQLGEAPMRLAVKAGAHKSKFELGGLDLRELRVSEAAADTQISFSTPNQAEMSSFTYETGASKVNLTRLGNANFAGLNFRGGAGDYTLDFSGQLLQDATVSIETGLSNLTLIVPAGVPASLHIEGGLANVNIEGDWGGSGTDYSQAGQGPGLTITVKTGAGNLNLRNQ